MTPDPNSEADGDEQGERQRELPLAIYMLGLTGFLVNPAVLGRVFAIAAGTATLASATNVSAMQLGITLAPLLGGLAISAGFGLPSVAWVGAVLGVIALGAALVDARLHRRVIEQPASVAA